MRDIFNLFFKATGYITRKQFILGAIGLFIFVEGMKFIVRAMPEGIAEFWVLLIYPLLALYMICCVYGKRLHDMGWSWWPLTGAFFAEFLAAITVMLAFGGAEYFEAFSQYDLTKRERFMGNLLFSPKGRIGPSDFIKGLAIIAVIGALITLMPLFSYALSQPLALASILLLFPLFCLLIKRCHDAGKSGWMSILFFLLIMIIGAVLQYFAGTATGGVEMQEMTAAMEELAESGAGFGEILEQQTLLMNEFGPAIAKNTALPSAIAGFIGTMLGGYITNFILKSDDHENQYGDTTL